MFKILSILILGYLLFRLVSKPALANSRDDEKEIDENVGYTEYEEID